MYSIKPYFSILLLSALFSCTREDSSQLNSSTPALSVSQSSVHTGQSVNLTIDRVVPNTISHWTLSSASGYTIDSAYSYSNNKIKFNQPGNYTITAEMKYAPCSAAALNHPGMDTCFMSGTSKGTVSSTVQVNQ